MRRFTYITVGKILAELKHEGVSLSRATFYRLERSLNFPSKGKSGGSWRVYTPQEAKQVKSMIKSNYKLGSSFNTSIAQESLSYLSKLFDLKKRGVVTEKEFEIKKKQLLGI